MRTIQKVGLASLVLLLGFAPGLAMGRHSNREPVRTGEGKKDKTEQGPTVRGVVQSLDPGKKSIVVRVVTDPAKKQTEEKTYPLAEDVKVVLADALEKKQAPPMGTVAQLIPDTRVDLQLSVDGKRVIAVVAHGPTIQGAVKSFDAARNTLTVTAKGKDGAKEMTVALARGAKVILDDGIGKKGDAPREGKATDLAEGARVSLQLSVDRKSALGIHIVGSTIQGTLKGHDAGARTITVTVKEDAQVVDKLLTLARGARIEGDLTAGSRVVVRQSVSDKEVAVAVRVLKDN